MHIDPLVALAGLAVGFSVGLTGMGGGALMTPILVLLFGVHPLTAVSSDLVASMVMKPVGGAVHVRRGTVNTAIVRWLMLGSVPAAFSGVLLLHLLGSGTTLQSRLQVMLGATLLLAAAAIVWRALLQGRASRGTGSAAPRLRARPVPTVLIGVLGGLIVGMTSVGSGSLIIVLLLLAYPTLSASELVGTDLVQAIPLVASAALGHLLFGQFQLALTVSLLIGAIPGAYLGARLSSRAPDGLVKPALVVVLLASGMKLIGVQTGPVEWILLAVAVVGLPVWGVLDAVRHSERHWSNARRRQGLWVWLQGAGAPFGVGFVASVLYFAAVRPRLQAATVADGSPDRS